MKIYLFFTVVVLLISCKKQTNECPGINRKVKFVLFTEQDFRNYADSITFTLSIRNSMSQTIWDSVLPPMRIMDIPGRENQLVVEKTLTGYENSSLRVGFIYQIENVGISWHWQQSAPCDTSKLVEFNFK